MTQLFLEQQPIEYCLPSTDCHKQRTSTIKPAFHSTEEYAVVKCDSYRTKAPKPRLSKIRIATKSTVVIVANSASPDQQTSVSRWCALTVLTELHAWTTVFCTT